MCTPGSLGVHITSVWSYNCTISAHSGTHFYGSTGGATELTFRSPVSAFGGYFGTNSGDPTFTIDFYDANGNLIDSRVESYVGQCVWSWFGWNIPGGAATIRITGISGQGGFVMMDDLQASDDPDPDGDGVDTVDDNCPADANPNQLDDDQDGLGNVCDNCPLDPNPDQEDLDGNGIGDACD
ncbi:MAG: thrombospondin type 3 repeat-containing protein, partial [Myxococcales bacterium]|nr:thrombospondin type 3 repeat-containing protein [Myxococcales bacterium]